MFPYHCPGCGKGTIYSRQASKAILDDGFGRMIEYPGFKCRKCGIDFHLGFACEAPHFEAASMKERRRQDEVTEQFTKLIQEAGGDRKRAIEILFERKGISPKANAYEYKAPPEAHSPIDLSIPLSERVPAPNGDEALAPRQPSAEELKAFEQASQEGKEQSK